MVSNRIYWRPKLNRTQMQPLWGQALNFSRRFCARSWFPRIALGNQIGTARGQQSTMLAWTSQGWLEHLPSTSIVRLFRAGVPQRILTWKIWMSVSTSDHNSHKIRSRNQDYRLCASRFRIKWKTLKIPTWQSCVRTRQAWALLRCPLSHPWVDSAHNQPTRSRGGSLRT